MSGDVIYVYGIVRDELDSTRVPEGIDDARVAKITSGVHAALVSRLPVTAYGAAEVEAGSGDVSWLSPRAMAHDRVLTWAHDHGGVIPLPMFSMWESTGSLSRWLDERATELERVFARVANADEFGLRVHRRDAVMLDAIDDLDDDVARLKREAGRATPGQRYLLERKIAEQGKGVVKAASHRIAAAVFDGLRAFSRAAIARPLAPEANRVPDATIVLNGAFLVERARNAEFRAAVADLVRQHEPRGLAFDFTGPWPPYNFVGSESLAAGVGKPGARS
jgi:hypothetical protein